MRLITVLFLLLAAMPLAADDHGELLNEEERRWLEALDRPLIVATEVNYHPYNFVDDRGQLSGVVGDYMEMLSDRLHLEDEVQSFDNFAQVLEAAKNREVDIVPLIVAAPERKSYLNFTQPIYYTRDRIFARQETKGTYDLADMAGVRLGIVESYAIQAELERDHPEIDLVPMATELDGLLAVSLGRIDAFVSEVGVSSYYIQREAITNLRIAGDVGVEDAQTFASRSDWPILDRILGKGLATFTRDEHTEILHRWIAVEGAEPHEIQRIWRQVGTGAGVVLLGVVGMLLWSLSLRRLVTARTQELEAEFAERRIVEGDKQRLAVAVEQSAEFVVVVDNSANIEYANLAFRRATGDSEFQGQAFSTLASDGHQNDLVEALRVVRELGHWRGQVSLRGADGDEIHVRMTVAPIYSDDHQLDGYVATGRDVTKEEQLEARVQQGERLSALGTLAGGIAHDFNNLLVPILGYTDLIRSEVADGARPYVDGIASASRRARDLVQRIMVFGRGGSGEMVPLDIRFEVDDGLSFLRSVLPTTIALEEDLKDSGTVLADRTQLQQLLLNLGTNAADAMADNGGTLSISLAPHRVAPKDEPTVPDLPAGNYALLTVRDTGVGMSESTKAKIFDPYFSDRQDSGGTGLGLAIVHGIVARHMGYIDVDSTPGAGTSFRIFLPQAAIEATHPGGESGVEMPAGTGETLLLVDDDELVITTLKKMLEDVGYQISAWTDPVAALNAFTAEPQAFDLVLADLMMPGLNGIELLNGARKVRPEIPVAIITGNPGAAQDCDYRVLAKPIPLDELAVTLRELLNPQAVS